MVSHSARCEFVTRASSRKPTLTLAQPRAIESPRVRELFGAIRCGCVLYGRLPQCLIVPRYNIATWENAPKLDET